MANAGDTKIIYGLDDKPEPRKAFVLALQHVLTMFGATISVPLLLGPAMEMSPAEISELISSVMLCSGVATILQVTIGSRLPIIQGVSFSFLAAFFAIIGSSQVATAAEAEGVTKGMASMQYIAGAVIAGSVFEIFIGGTGLVGKLRRILSPVVVGPVIMLIGLALFQHGAPKAGGYWPISIPVMVMIVVFSLVLSKRTRIFQLFPILMAIVLGYGACLLLTSVGVFAPGHPCHVDLTYAAQAPLFKSPTKVFFPWGFPKFDIAFIIAVLAGFLASMIESVGDYHAASNMAGAGDPDDKQISKGIMSEGIGCFATGLLGGFSSTSYSENIGLIGLTKVASRHVVFVGGFILVGVGLIAKIGAFVSAIPSPVVGALYCALFGLISAIGIQQLAKADLHSDRNLLIAGGSLFMGLSVPAYFAAAVDPAIPGQMMAIYQPTGEALLASLPTAVRDVVVAVGSSGMAVGALLAIVLDNTIPGTDEERGLVHD